MKRSLLVTSIAALSLGAAPLLHSQDSESAPTIPPPPIPGSEADAKAPGNPGLEVRGVPEDVKVEVEEEFEPAGPPAPEIEDSREAPEVVAPEPGIIQETRPAPEPVAAPETAEPAAAETAPTKARRSDPSLPGIRTKAIATRKSGGREIVVAPLGSIFTVEEKFFVLAMGAESNIDFQQREVRLGRTDGIVVEVTAGLQPGDEVLTVSSQQLRFPDFDAGLAGNCGPNACPPGIANGDLFIPASDFFAGDVIVDFGPGPGMAPPAPFFGGGPGFCPDY